MAKSKTFGQNKATPGGRLGGTSLSPTPVSGGWDGHPGIKARANSTDVRTGTVGNVKSAKAC